MTDFPIAGDVRRVSLRTSNFKPFDLRFAIELRKLHPDLWRLGDTFIDRDGFDELIPIQRRGGSIRNGADEATIRFREAWAMQHSDGTELGEVVAQIRWLVVGRLGIDRMKALINDQKALT